MFILWNAHNFPLIRCKWYFDFCEHDGVLFIQDYVCFLILAQTDIFALKAYISKVGLFPDFFSQ